MSGILYRSPPPHVTPAMAGWRYLSFRVERGAFEGDSGDEEIAIVPLSGAVRVEIDERSWDLGGRETVFAGMPWALYLPPATPYRVEAEGEFAVCGARCDSKREPKLVRPEDVEIEIRGAGNATRQINHIIRPDFPAERLLIVEVFTPSGNWSSYPPHKHDEDMQPEEVVLEEIYYFRTADEGGFAVQRIYSPQHGLDLTETVYDGDLVLVPYGYHTTAAAPGYDLYYLNALAGDARSMASSDDPELHWVRGSWRAMERDSRVPLITL